MKKYAEKYAYELLITSLALLIALVGLCAYVFLVFYGEMREERSRALLYQSRLEDAEEKLDLSLTEQEDRLAYHYAAVAAELCAEKGDHPAALLYGKVANTILQAPEQMSAIQKALESYRDTGEIPHTLVGQEADGEEELRSVSMERWAAAEDCVERMYGTYHALHPGAKARNGELVFTGSNAYAIIDGRTGLPVEAAISLSPARKILGADACIGAAKRFLAEYFPEPMATGAVLETIDSDERAGTFELTYRYGEKRMVLSVRRDNGRVARLTTR